MSKTVVQKAATCTESGISTNYCTCGYSWTNVTPATGHNYITVHKDPTCTEDGYNKEVCRVDGDVKTNTVLPATGHDTKMAKTATFRFIARYAMKKLFLCENTIPLIGVRIMMQSAL